MSEKPPILAFLLCIAATTGCGPPADTSFDVVYDPCAALVVAPAADASEPERAGIAQAITMWNELAGTRLTLLEEPGARHLPINFENAALAFLGVYDDESGTVTINRQLEDSRERAITIAHELGHAFGLPHVERDERRSVMNQANREVLPNGGDVSALRAVWGACEPPAP